MRRNNFEDKEFNEKEYFEDWGYEIWLESEEGKKWQDFHNVLHPIKNKELVQKLVALKEKSKKYTEEERKQLFKEFDELQTYEDKLNFWQEKELSLLDENYFRDLVDRKNLIFIQPYKDSEKSLYLTKLVEWINIVNEEDRDKSYDTLVKDYQRLEINESVIKEQITITENSIENIKREFGLESEVINFFLSIYQQKYIVDWYKLSSHHIYPFGFQVLAYKISKVIGFVKYKMFLKGELDKLRAKLDFNANTLIEKDNVENLAISKFRTFKRNEKYKNDVILKKVLDELIKKNFIKKIEFKDFVKVFEYQPIELGKNELESKIIWIKEYKNSTKNKKSYDWTELLTLIECITDIDKKDFSNSNKEIRDIIMCCFEFDDKTMVDKQQEILKRIKTFVKNDSRKETQIEKLINSLVF
ncbi:hypothetical protein PG614_03890 [Riemerella anatipestifer]|nr:hypothetical protein [Riemerella anatipestifer]MDY3532362.1 hypothetical protein [Riemerella anatipestifer]MDY3535083.1 hypothetical protein [Riemerella anatipestifer]